MEGTVEAKSEKNKSMKLGGEWLDCEDVWKYAKNVNKGDRVKFDAKEVEGKRNKNMTFIKVIGKGPAAAAATKKWNGEDPKIIRRENVLRTAVMYIESQRGFAKGPITVSGVKDIAKQFLEFIEEGK